MDAPNMRRIVILGKTGSGKSSVGNTIFGEDKFTVCHKSISAESPCLAKTKPLNGRQITLIDTPGFFDTNKPEESLKPEIVKCITECSPGPHAFLILLKLETFTELENKIIQQITQYFSEEVFKFATVVFTHGDDLQEDEKIKNYVNENSVLKRVVEKCGGRCHVIDNKYWKHPSDETYRSNAYQVKEILKSVEEIVEKHNGNCYTNEFLQVVKEMTQQEEERIAQSSENMSREEIRQKAKSRVCDILNKAAGVTTGALLGALFGVAVTAVAAKAISDLTAKLVKMYPLLKLAESAVAAGGKTFGVAAGTSGSTAGAGVGAAVLAAAPETTYGAAGGITAGGVVLGTAAAAGAGFGAYKGYQAGEEAETPWEAVKKTAEVVRSSGKDAINQVEEFSTTFLKEHFQ